MAWSNSEKATPTVVAECQSEVLRLVPCSTGIVVILKNGLAFNLKYDRPNWDVQTAPLFRGTFSWADILHPEQQQMVVLLLAEDGRSIHRFLVNDPTTRAIIKAPAKFSITTCCLHNRTLFVGNSQAKLLYLDGDTFVPSKIDLKLESPDMLSCLISCGKDILVTSHTKISLWDEQFGLMKTSSSIDFTPWPNKGMFFNDNKALFVHVSLMVLPMKTQKSSLAALAGSKKRKTDKKCLTNYVDLCDHFLNHVDTWSTGDIAKKLQQLDDISEMLIVKCWKRILAVDPSHEGVVTKIVTARHECHKLTEVLHEFVSLDEVQKSIELLADFMENVSLVQLAATNILESFMDWACHLVDAHRNALKVSLRSENDTTKGVLQKLDRSLRKVEELSKDLREGRYRLNVALDKTDKVTIPREKIYWVEPWTMLDSKNKTGHAS